MTFASALNCRSKQTVAFTAINSRNSRSLLVQYISMSDVLLKYLLRHELLKLVKLSVVSAQVQVSDEWMSTPAGLCAVFPTAGSTSSCRGSAIRWTNLPRPRVDFLRAPKSTMERSYRKQTAKINPYRRQCNVPNEVNFLENIRCVHGVRKAVSFLYASKIVWLYIQSFLANSLFAVARPSVCSNFSTTVLYCISCFMYAWCMLV